MEKTFLFNNFYGVSFKGLVSNLNKEEIQIENSSKEQHDFAFSISFG